MRVSSLGTLLLGIVFDLWHCWAGDQTVPDIASCMLQPGGQKAAGMAQCPRLCW